MRASDSAGLPIRTTALARPFRLPSSRPSRARNWKRLSRRFAEPTCKPHRLFRRKRSPGYQRTAWRARKSPVELEPVEVHVYELELLEFDGAAARIRVRCSAGTYLRSIAQEAGQRLGCGAFLEALRRTGSGDFKEDQAHTLEATGTAHRSRKTRRSAHPGVEFVAATAQRDRRPAHCRSNPARQGFPVVSVRGPGQYEIRQGNQPGRRANRHRRGPATASLSSDLGAVRQQVVLEEIPTTTSSASAMVYEPQPAILAWLRRSAHKERLERRDAGTAMIHAESRLCRRARRCRCDYGRRGRPSEPEPALRGENRTSTIHGCLEADGWRLEALDSPSNGDQGRLT